MKLNRLFPVAIVITTLSLTSCTTEDGLDGVKGDPGTIGETGANGIACWDLNGDGINDDDEDSNQDGEFNAFDCRGMDGTNGTNGENGTNGTNGEDGGDGNDGANGLGLEDMLKFGSISMNLEGVRPDDVAFTDEETFRYMPVEGDDIDDYNLVITTIIGEDTEYEFKIRRFLSSPDATYQNTNVDIELTITNPGEPGELITKFIFEIDRYAVIGNDNKYFVLDGAYENDQQEEVTDYFIITEVSFDTSTNNLQFSYSFTVDADGNDSGHELDVSGNVDVFVLELIN